MKNNFFTAHRALKKNLGQNDFGPKIASIYAKETRGLNFS
jgi:hypothetical protein